MQTHCSAHCATVNRPSLVLDRLRSSRRSMTHVRRFRSSAPVCHFKLNLAHYPPVLGTGSICASCGPIIIAVSSEIRRSALPHGHPAAEQRCPPSTAERLPLPQVSTRTRKSERATKVFRAADSPNAPAGSEPACTASTPRRCRRVEEAAGVLLGA
jgi:hypothetical protein